MRLLRGDEGESGRLRDGITREEGERGADVTEEGGVGGVWIAGKGE